MAAGFYSVDPFRDLRREREREPELSLKREHGHKHKPRTMAKLT